MLNLLLVEDDKHLANGLATLIRHNGYHCTVFNSAEEAMNHCDSNRPDLCVLDRNLPGQSGNELCLYLKQQWPELPVLILSACNAERDRVDALLLGADDYVGKPFSIPELLARIQTMARRIPLLQAPKKSSADLPHVAAPVTRARSDSKRFMMDDLTICPDSMRAYRNEQSIDLTPRELKVLQQLYQHAGSVITRDRLFDIGWGRDYLPESRALDQSIAVLRGKVERDARKPRIIRTARGAGYRYDPPGTL
ncbi:response regulator transcription factor [Oceanospirillum sediminis]|uniref:Response regulator transcription factor n=1 Tax=Oceanospirillum sediminis TaxID=2760088 RepID=A0A839IVQ6_9GAMM|nr:response regulator transcription factor [Oceanospirillum sediminis]MBB1488704.1 response regulator transcription factor [Oceanospirillum sediminis]